MINRKIEDLYLNNGVLLFNVDIESISTLYIGFNYNDFKILISLLKENGVIISSIESYKNKDYIPPEYNYSGENIDENYNEIGNYLNMYENNNKEYLFSLIIADTNLENSINNLLISKYNIKISEEEKLERKNRGWEFIE